MGRYKKMDTMKDERNHGVDLKEQLTVSYDKVSKTVVIALDDRGLALYMDEAASVFVDLGHILQDHHNIKGKFNDKQ